MIRTVFLAFYRSVVRHPLYAGLNLAGLGLGIAVLLGLGLFVRFETSFERWIPGVDGIYEVQRRFTGLDGSFERIGYATSGGLLEDLRTDDPAMVGVRVWENDLTVHAGGKSIREKEQLADPAFFDVFDLDFAAGDKKTALARPDGIVVTERIAARYFPNQPALGATMTLTDAEGTHLYTISGILRNLPQNTDLELDFVRALTPQRIKLYGFGWRNYGMSDPHTFLKLTFDQAHALNESFDAFVDAKAGDDVDQVPAHKALRLRVHPLTSLHLENSRMAVWSLAVVGLAAFIVAAINYVNLATARAGLRAKEVAVRKTLGASETSLRIQFLGESILNTLLATLIGLAILEVCAPFIRAYSGVSLPLTYDLDWREWLCAAAAIVAVGVLSGLYPAVLLSSSRAGLAASASRAPMGGRFAVQLREGLVLLQFSVVIAFFVLITGFVDQIRHLERADPGFHRDGLLFTNATLDEQMTVAQRDALQTVWRTLPGAISVTEADSSPGDADSGSDWIALEGQTGIGPSATYIQIGSDYFQTYEAKLLAGRFPDPIRDGGAVVLNLAAARSLGIDHPEDAIDRQLNFGGHAGYRIVGVVRDMRFRSPRQKIAPTLYFPNAHIGPSSVSLRFKGVDEAVMRARMAEAWTRVAPEIPFSLVSATQRLDRYVRPDQDRQSLFTMGALATLLIGCLGLHGLAAFNTARRAREIGLRKVLGGTRGAIVLLLVGQFLRPVWLANLIAWPVAYWILNRWLAQFDDRISLNIGYFLLASGGAMLIAFATVSASAFASARISPAAAFRTE